MKIFAIETSCDETSLAHLEVRRSGFDLHKHIIASQAAIHAQYGGVVPEVAARKHSEVLLPLIAKSIGMAALRSADLLAVTSGPGLITSLMVGTETAKTLSFSLGKPLIGINHLEAHIYANWLTYPELFHNDKEIFPSLALIVSGGHTEFVIMTGHGKYRLIGQTLDDAAGEAFDKVAKILNLGYPGGPIISRLAEQGNAQAIDFPRPMIASKDCNVSFAGLKTAVLYYLQRQKKIRASDMPDIAASFQQAVIDVIAAKTTKAVKQYKVKSILMGGGVVANKRLTESIRQIGDRQGLPVYTPKLEFTGDNAAMIAAAAYYHRHDRGQKDNWKKLRFDPQMRLAQKQQ